jgi:hypothetical protein
MALPGRVRAVAHGGEFLLAVRAFSAGDLKGGNNTLADFDILHVGPDTVDDSHEL